MTPVNDGGFSAGRSQIILAEEREHTRAPMFLLEFLEEGREPASPPQLYLNLNLTIRRSVSQRESELGTAVEAP